MSAVLELTRLVTSFRLDCPRGSRETSMPRTRPPYPDGFRARIVALHRAGHSTTELAVEFGPSIRDWIRDDDGRSRRCSTSDDAASLGFDEREELRTLRREVKQLRQEHESLTRPGVWFAWEAGLGAVERHEFVRTHPAEHAARRWRSSSPQQ